MAHPLVEFGTAFEKLGSAPWKRRGIWIVEISRLRKGYGYRIPPPHESWIQTGLDKTKEWLGRSPIFALFKPSPDVSISTCFRACGDSRKIWVLLAELIELFDSWAIIGKCPPMCRNSHDCLRILD